jgi:hypothetical protein
MTMMIQKTFGLKNVFEKLFLEVQLCFHYLF